MGGTHMTNDLAIGLKTDLEIAEAVKIKHARLGDTIDRPIRIVVDETAHNFSGGDVNMIVEARVEELLEFVEKELQRIHRARKLPGGVVIVGGSSVLPGLAEFAREKLQLPARIGKVRGLAGLVDTVDTPAFATAAGLMLLDILLTPLAHEESQNHSFNTAGVTSTLNKLWGRIKP
jgi:cell division protein FtsA